jgi:hypothetical protein
MGIELYEEIITDIHKNIRAEVLRNRRRSVTHKCGFFQILAMRERASSDARHTFGNNDFRYIFQERKGFRFYSGHSGRQHVLIHICRSYVPF